MKRKIAILGATGSIGTQTLDVVSRYPDHFEVFALTANSRVELLAQQARTFLPEVAVIADEQKYFFLKDALKDLPVKVMAGREAICQTVRMDAVDLVLAAIVGYAGLEPAIAAIRAQKTVALANKETLVVAGELITRLAVENRTPILPVDSEHSAIFQCLTGEDSLPEKIFLTASGGPFRKHRTEDLQLVTKADALKHPNWSMGAKITIDSSTMMNKGFEMIEACWLFNLRPEQVEIVVHPQSVVHSMVQFCDGSVKAQLGLPDMRLPIQYALSFPQRLASPFPRLDLAAFGTLTFEKPDTEKFPALTLAYEAVRKGGNMPCIMNAANEVAVNAFLENRIRFLQMSDVVAQTMQKTAYIAHPDYSDYVQTDAEARAVAEDVTVRRNGKI